MYTKNICRSSSEAERRIANSEVVISKFIYGLKRTVVGSGLLRILVIHFPKELARFNSGSKKTLLPPFTFFNFYKLTKNIINFWMDA